MDVFVDLLKIIVPAAIVLYAMYLVVRSFLKKQTEEKWLEIKQLGSKEIMPIRIQAFERMVLYLERISPQQMVMRLNSPEYNARELQSVLLREIREEFNHNLAQQIYISNAAWDSVKNAKEHVIMLINTASDQLAEDARGIDLARKILQLAAEEKQDLIGFALVQLKNEVRALF